MLLVIVATAGGGWTLHPYPDLFPCRPGLHANEFFAVFTQPDFPPIADAGYDQEVISSNGAHASITLDGSLSYDPDGDQLEYSWSLAGSQIATGETATVTLLVGEHEITLTVDDGTYTGSDTVVVKVITMSQATDNLADFVESLGLPDGVENSLLASLNASADSFDKGNVEAGVKQLQAFQNKVEAQSGKKITSEDALTLRGRAQEIIDAALG